MNRYLIYKKVDKIIKTAMRYGFQCYVVQNSTKTFSVINSCGECSTLIREGKVFNRLFITKNGPTTKISMPEILVMLPDLDGMQELYFRYNSGSFSNKKQRFEEFEKFVEILEEWTCHDKG